MTMPHHLQSSTIRAEEVCDVCTHRPIYISEKSGCICTMLSANRLDNARFSLQNTLSIKAANIIHKQIGTKQLCLSLKFLLSADFAYRICRLQTLIIAAYFLRH